MLLSLQLKKLEFIFDIAKDGVKAFEMFQESDYDAVLTDINVPRLTGDELAASIRRLTNTEKANVPIIALTATILQDDIDAYLQSGLNAILVKPFKQEELKDTLEKFLFKACVKLAENHIFTVCIHPNQRQSPIGFKMHVHFF
jgi:CheY-like chemotaxis protein